MFCSILLPTLFCAFNLATISPSSASDHPYDILRLAHHPSGVSIDRDGNSMKRGFDTAALRAKLVYPEHELMRRIHGTALAWIEIEPEGKVYLTDVYGEPGFRSALRRALVDGGLVDTGRTDVDVTKAAFTMVHVEFSTAIRDGRIVGDFKISIVDPRQGNGFVQGEEQTKRDPNANDADGEIYPDPDEFVELTRSPEYDEVDLMQRVRYPDAARRNGIEGLVVVRALVSKRGKVVKTIIDRSDAPALNDAAVEAVKQTQLTPAMQGDRPTACWIQVPIMFKLR